MPPNYDLKNAKESYLTCLERSVSNLIGGIAFYSGTIERVDNRKNNEKDVFSATPSR